MAIEGVIHEFVEDSHKDDRRTILTAFNGDLGDFVAKQVKILQIHSESILGEHYHSNYRELYYMLEGEVEFTLEDIHTKEREIYTLKTGERLLVPPNVAHRVLAKPSAVMVGCTEKPYISAEINDCPYKFS